MPCRLVQYDQHVIEMACVKYLGWGGGGGDVTTTTTLRGGTSTVSVKPSTCATGGGYAEITGPGWWTEGRGEKEGYTGDGDEGYKGDEERAGANEREEDEGADLANGGDVKLDFTEEYCWDC